MEGTFDCELNWRVSHNYFSLKDILNYSSVIYLYSMNIFVYTDLDKDREYTNFVLYF